MHTDKATPFNYGVLHNATKSATFREKSILLLEQWLPNLQFWFLHVLDFEALRLHFKYTYEGWNFKSGNYLFTTDTK